MRIILIGLNISKYSKKGVFNRFQSLNRAKVFTLFFLGFFIFSTCFSQEAKVNVEIRSAIENVKIGNYEKAIPVFKKNLNSKKLDEFTKLEIQIFLGFCNLVAKKGKVNVDYLNLITKDYFENQEKISQDSLTKRKEAELFYFLGQVNFNTGNYEKMISNLLKVRKYYNDEKIEKDKIYTNILFQLVYGNYNLSNYTNSIEQGEELIDLNRQISGDLNLTLKCFYLMYDSYLKLNQFVKSLEYLEKWLEISPQIISIDSKDYLYNQINQAELYTRLGNYSKSLNLYIRVNQYIEKLWGDNSTPFFFFKNNLSLAYSAAGDFKSALKVSMEIEPNFKMVVGELNSDYISILNNQAYFYSNLGEFKKAIEIERKVVDFRLTSLGDLHPDYLLSLGNLSSTYSDLGDFKTALDLDLKITEKKKIILGENHPDYLLSLGNLAQSYAELGDFKSALSLQLKVVESSRSIFGDDHPNHFIKLSNLASFFADSGDIQKALEIEINVSENLKLFLGESHPDYLLSLANLARYYSDLGNYKKAFEIEKELVIKNKDILGEFHPQFLVSLGNLASSYSDLGDFKKSLRTQLKVVENKKITLGELHPDYLLSLGNLARYYSSLGDYKKAFEIEKEIVIKNKKNLGEFHPQYLLSLGNLASSYSDLGDYKESLRTQLNVVKLEETVLGDNHPKYLSSLDNLSKYYFIQGDFKSAIEIIQKVVNGRKEIWGFNHPSYISSSSDLSLLEIYFDLNRNSIYNYIKTLEWIKKNMINYSGVLTEYQRGNFLDNDFFYFEIFPWVVEKTKNFSQSETQSAFDFSLFTKGLLLNTTLDFDQLLLGKGSSEILEKYKELKLLKLQIQRLYDKPIGDRYLDVDSLEYAAREIESELIKESKEYGDFTQNLNITWKDVQSNLGDRDVAIEFIEYPTFADDTVKYVALVLRKGWENPKFVPLFRKDHIDEIIKHGPNKIYSNGIVGKEIKKLVWDPLEEFIAPGDKVYFSAAGILHQLAIENLSFDESTTLGDRYQIYRLSSTKELALEKHESKNQNVALYGGIKYDLSLDQMIARSEKYERKDSFLAIRGIDQDSLDRKGWQFLPGTLAEANEVSQILRENQYQVTEFIGESGSEESLKDLSGKRTGIIHIATHGFFLPVEQSKRNPFIQMRFNDRNDNAGYVDPMLRSGLLLAGGNRAWQGDSIPDTIEDGVLTAKEISNLDLRETDLVVLSACETGLGDVSSEGVFGLQRAFKQAGAQTIIMSLWNVKDEATQYLMTNFYSYLTQGASKREAFIQARNKCRERYQDPASWAAFIMLD